MFVSQHRKLMEVITIANEDAPCEQLEPYGLTAFAPLIPVHVFGPSKKEDLSSGRSSLVEGHSMLDS